MPNAPRKNLRNKEGTTISCFLDEKRFEYVPYFVLTLIEA